MRLDGVKGFVLDIDGTLVHREGETIHVQPGASDVLASIRSSGRRFVLFTNGSHMPPEAFADELRRAGLDVLDDELLTPLNSVRFYLQTHEGNGALLAFVNDSAREYLEQTGLSLARDETSDIGAVFVAHSDAVDFAKLERAARALLQGPPLLTGSYAPYYAGFDGPVFSRGAMLTAALAKASGAEPIVVGKPSQAALAAIRDRLGLTTEEIAVIGDDLTMDVALGRLGGSHTVLVQSGISGRVELEHIAEEERPDAVIERVGALLDWL